MSRAYQGNRSAFQRHPQATSDISRRGNWVRIAVKDDRGHWRFYYYWRHVRLPWLAWAMFS